MKHFNYLIFIILLSLLGANCGPEDFQFDRALLEDGENEDLPPNGQVSEECRDCQRLQSQGILAEDCFNILLSADCSVAPDDTDDGNDNDNDNDNVNALYQYDDYDEEE